MKHTIFGFQQSILLELNLTLEHASIIRHFADFCNTDKMVKIMVEDKFYYWFKYDGIIEDLPIINKKKDTIYRMLKLMAEKGIFDRYTLKRGGTFSYYRLNPKMFERLITKPEIKEKSEVSDQNPERYGSESGTGTDQNPERYGSESGTNNSSTKDHSAKDNASTKPQEGGADYSAYSVEFLQTMISFKEMRNEKKEPLSLKAEHMVLKKLIDICGMDEAYQIEVLEQSIINRWKGVFPISNRNQLKQFGAKDITPDIQERILACPLPD